MKLTGIIGSVLALASIPSAQAATLSVQVINSQTGAPAVGASVFGGVDGTGVVVKTDSSGKAVLTLAGSGPYTVTAAGLEQTKIFTILSSVSVLTTMQGVTGPDVTILLGPYEQFSPEQEDNTGASNATLTGTVAGLTPDPTTGYAGYYLQDPYTIVSGGTTSTSVDFSIAASSTGTSFLAAMQVPTDDLGYPDLAAAPTRFAISYDIASLTQSLALGPGFDRSTTLNLANGVAGSTTCGDYVVHLPGNRGTLVFAQTCDDTLYPTSLAFTTPSLSGSLSGATLSFDGNTSTATTQQLAGKSGFGNVSSVSLTLPSVLTASPYTPLALTNIQGTSFDFTSPDQVKREVVFFSETHSGNNGHLLATTLWTVVNLKPSGLVTFPMVPRSVPFPAPGSNSATINSQTAVVVAEINNTSAYDYAYSARWLDTTTSTTTRDSARALQYMGGISETARDKLITFAQEHSQP